MFDRNLIFILFVSSAAVVRGQTSVRAQIADVNAKGREARGSKNREIDNIVDENEKCLDGVLTTGVM